MTTQEKYNHHISMAQNYKKYTRELLLKKREKEDREGPIHPDEENNFFLCNFYAQKAMENDEKAAKIQEEWLSRPYHVNRGELLEDHYGPPIEQTDYLSDDDEEINWEQEF